MPPPSAGPVRGAGARPGGPAVAEISAFAKLLRELETEVDRGDRLARDALAAARGTTSLSPAELIALQAGVYRYSEVLELAARLVDRSTSAVKTVLQSP